MAGTRSGKRPRGQIRPRGDSFQVIVFAGHDPLSKRRMYLRETVATEAAAKKALTRLVAQVDAQKHPKTRASFRVAMDTWLRTHDVEETTRASYEQYARAHLYPAFGDEPVSRVTTQVLEEFYAELRRCSALSDGALRARVAAWERERNWAPRWVDEELAATHEHRERRAHDVTIWNAHAAAPDISPDDAVRLRVEAAEARAEVEQLDAQLADLEMASNARALWAAHTMVTRDKAERSEFELRARGLDPYARADRTTAEDWLAAHRHEQAMDEYRRHVHERDFAHDHADHHDRHVDDAPVDRTEDIRERSTPDLTEHTDMRRRRYVPPLPEMAEAVERAHVAVDEMAAREPCDDAQAADEATGRAAAEEARRADLIRWSTKPAAVEVRASRDSSDDDTLARDR